MREALLRTGQRFMVGFEGLDASADIRRMIRDYGVGGVILFARNVDAPEQVAELVRELQAIARDAFHELPLMIGIDQEGGRVARLGAPWTRWPPLRALGRGGSDELARGMGKALASELLACGIACDFAPVLDVDTNSANPIIGDRSFGDDPELVGRLGAAMIAGLQGNGVAACAKHFPGHGDTQVDSHLALPLVDHSRSRLDDVELRPFRMAVAGDVAMIMTAHVLVRELDDQWPATLSTTIIDGILRRQLGYAGVIVSDDLEMKAVADRWKPSELSLLAAQAGCDLLLVCQSHHAQVDAIEGMVRGLESEQLAWTGMDDACARIKRLKQRFLLPYRDPHPRSARMAAGVGENVVLAREIADRGGMALV
jgi:beta-N-acetylhexosaminidase